MSMPCLRRGFGRQAPTCLPKPRRRQELDKKGRFSKISKFENKQLCVCYYGSYDLNEPHNTTYLAGLKEVGIQVNEIHLLPLRERDEAGKYASIPSVVTVIFGFVINSISLFFRLLKTRNIDAVIVGYPGYFDLPPAKIFSVIKRIPVIFNIHISLYETLVIDRQYYKKKSVIAGFIKWYDKLTIHLSDTVIVDTRSHGVFFSKLYDVPAEKFQRVFIGADPIFKPTAPVAHNTVKVLFYGTFIPLQGIDYIVRAADLLRDEPCLKFEIIGRGQTREKILRLANQLRIDNIDFIEWVNRYELVQRIADADICLGGQFGLTPKADLVIGYKCYQMMACGKAIIVSDSRGNLELLTHGNDCYMCKAGDVHDLAEAILTLKNDSVMREKLAAASRQTFTTKSSTAQIGNDLYSIIAMAIER